MDIVNLLAGFADPETLKTLTFNEKMVASLVVAMLGMGITFIALIVLQLVIGLMAKFANGVRKPAKSVGVDVIEAEAADPLDADGRISGEVVAAITTAVALLLDKPVGDFVVRDIRKVQDSTSAWSRAGILEQMQTRNIV